MTSPKKTVYQSVEKGDKETLAELLEIGHDPDECAKSGNTPLRRAVDRGKGDIVNMLLDAGANPFRMVEPIWHIGRSGQETDKWLPLHLAMFKGHAGIAERLINSMIFSKFHRPNIEDFKNAKNVTMSILGNIRANDGKTGKTLSIALCILTETDIDDKEIFRGIEQKGVSDSELVKKAFLIKSAMGRNKSHSPVPT